MRVLSVIMILFASCSDSLNENKLIGRYVFSHARGLLSGSGTVDALRGDTLELKSDRTYHYWVITEKKLENSGKWKLNSLGNEVEFEKFSFLTNGLPPIGSWYSRIKLDDNEVYLIYASEEGQYYRKIDK